VLLNVVSLVALFALVFLASVFRFTKEKSPLADQRGGSHNYFELNYASADAAPEGTAECFSDDGASESACESSTEGATECC